MRSLLLLRARGPVGGVSSQVGHYNSIQGRPLPMQWMPAVAYFQTQVGRFGGQIFEVLKKKSHRLDPIDTNARLSHPD